MNYLLKAVLVTGRHACRGGLSPLDDVDFLWPLKSAVSFHGVTSASVASVLRNSTGTSPVVQWIKDLVSLQWPGFDPCPRELSNAASGAKKSKK